MTTDNSHDQVEIPEGELAGESGPAAAPRKAGMKMSTKIVLLGGAGMLALAFGLTFSGADATSQSVVQKPPAMDATPGGAVQAENERFQESLRSSNDQRAETAAERGVTFLPTPEVLLEPIAEEEAAETVAPVTAIPSPVEEEPEAVEVTRRPIAPPPPVVRPVEAQPTVTPIPVAADTAPAAVEQEEEKNPFLQNMIGQMGAVTAAQELPVSAKVEFEIEEVPVEAPVMGGGAADASAAAGADPSLYADNPLLGGGAAISGENLMLKPGDVIYGETLTSVNSDAPSPILVEITAGDLKGARLIGEFSVPEGDDRMVVSFSRMTLEDGTTIGINAFAVDGRSAETAVASDIDRRYVSRYAPVFAATFLSAMAAAASIPGQQIEEETGNIVMEEATREQAAWAGVAAGTETIAADIANHAPKGPLITLRDGYPVGILFIDPVENPN